MSYCHHQSGSINLSYCCHFLWFCAGCGCNIICCRCRRYPRKAGFGVFHYCTVLRHAQISECIMVRWSYSLYLPITLPHYHHYVNVWRCFTSKMFVMYILSSVCLRLRIFSQLYFMQYTGLCVFSLPTSLVMIVRIRVLCHHQIGSRTPLPFFRVRPCNNGMRRAFFYILIQLSLWFIQL